MRLTSKDAEPMSMRSTLAVLLGVSMLSACSTVPTTPTQVPKGAAIVISRDSGFFGMGCNLDVTVNSEVVGKLGAGETVVRQVEAGKHRVGIANTTALCINVRMSKVVEVTKDPVVFRVGLTAGGQWIFDQTE